MSSGVDVKQIVKNKKIMMTRVQSQYLNIEPTPITTDEPQKIQVDYRKQQ